jgi:hypothetical protein
LQLEDHALQVLHPSGAGWVGKARGLELGLGVAGSQPEREATVDQQIGRGGLAREKCGVVEVGVEYVSAQPCPLSDLGGQHQRGKRGRHSEVVDDRDRVVAKVLGGAAFLDPVAATCCRPQGHAEPKRASVG